MVYIIINNINSPKVYAKELSEELWKILRPNPNQDDVTKYMFENIEHPTSGKIALVVDLDYNILIDSNYNVTRLKELISDDVDADTRESLESKLAGKTKIKFSEILPPQYKVETYESMIQKGWFDNPEL